MQSDLGFAVNILVLIYKGSLPTTDTIVIKCD